MQEPAVSNPAVSNSASAVEVRPNQLALQQAAFRAFVGLSREVAEPENAKLQREHARAIQALEQAYARAMGQLERDYQSTRASGETKLSEQLADISRQHDAQLAALEAEYAKRCRRTEDDTGAALKDVKKQAEQDLWLADSVADATQEQIKREREKLDQKAPSLFKRIDEVEERAGWVLCEYRYNLPAEIPAAPYERPAGQTSEQAVHELYEKSVDQLDTLERLNLPHLVVGFAPYGLGMLICGLILAGAGAASYFAPQTFQFGWLGPSAFVLSLVVWLLGWRIIRKRATAQIESTAIPLFQTLAAARAAVDRHLRSEHDRMDRRESHSLHKRTEEIRRAEDFQQKETSELEQRRERNLAKLQETYLKAKVDFAQQRDTALQQAEEDCRSAQAKLEERHARRKTRLAARQERERAALEAGQAEARRLMEDKWRDGLALIRDLAEQSDRLERLAPDWGQPGWREWQVSGTFMPTIRFGEWELDLSRLAPCVRERFAANGELAPILGPAAQTVRVPAVLELPDRCSLLVQTAQKSRDQAVRALQATMARLLTSLPPGRVHFTIIDPVGLGESFAGFMHLADYDEALINGRIWTEKNHIEQRLGDLTAHMENVIQKYLRNEFESIDAYNVQAGELAEPYRFLIVADFPTNFSEESLHRLASIVSSGPRCGVYTLIAHDKRLPLPPGHQMEDLQSGSTEVTAENGEFLWRDEALQRFPLALDVPPDQELLTELMQKVGQAAGRAKRVEVPFEFITPTAEQLWAGDSRHEIRVPLGRTGAVRLQDLRLGRGVAQHALIAGKTGSGKSTLLHVLITNLVLWYPPDEVEFYLIDFKKGVEFKTYATHELPHARAIAIESDREFGLSVLHRLDGEMERRGEMFRAAGVQDLGAFRDATGKKLPRTLLVVDEFQVFFSEDDKIAQDAAILLDRLVRQGRAFGIHVILGSQTLGGTSGLARSTIGQMAVRIALQCSDVDSQLIFDDGNSAARLLSRPGEAIYNDAGGLLQGNSPFQTAWLSDDVRDTHLDRIIAMSQERSLMSEAPIVFEGNAPAEIRRNRGLMDALGSFASTARGGAGAPAAPAFWMGEAVAIKDPTAAVLRRQSGANLLLIGQRDDAALAIMTAGLLGLAAQYAPNSAEFVLLDGSSPDAPQNLQSIASVLPHATRVVEYRAVSEAIAELVTEMHRRQEEGAPGDPAVFAFIYGLQRYRVLRKSEDSFSFSYSSSDEEKAPAADRQLAELLREGPAVGMHVIAWADTPASVERTFDRPTLREFDNRVLFQMSAADSSNLIDSPMANRLGFYRALFFSEEQGLLEKFRPYSLPDREFLDEVRASLHTS